MLVRFSREYGIWWRITDNDWVTDWLIWQYRTNMDTTITTNSICPDFNDCPKFLKARIHLYGSCRCPCPIPVRLCSLCALTSLTQPTRSNQSLWKGCLTLKPRLHQATCCKHGVNAALPTTSPSAVGRTECCKSKMLV